jgi:hypothetical protein
MIAVSYNEGATCLNYCGYYMHARTDIFNKLGYMEPATV